jgi:hypothetical protein
LESRAIGGAYFENEQLEADLPDASLLAALVALG